MYDQEIVVWCLLNMGNDLMGYIQAPFILFDIESSAYSRLTFNSITVLPETLDLLVVSKALHVYLPESRCVTFRTISPPSTTEYFPPVWEEHNNDMILLLLFDQVTVFYWDLHHGYNNHARATIFKSY